MAEPAKTWRGHLIWVKLTSAPRGAAPYPYVHAVNEVSFELWAGETLGLVGESGSGKTTTLEILRLRRSEGGPIEIAGREIGAAAGKDADATSGIRSAAARSAPRRGRPPDSRTARTPATRRVTGSQTHCRTSTTSHKVDPPPGIRHINWLGCGGQPWWAGLAATVASAGASPSRRTACFPVAWRRGRSRGYGWCEVVVRKSRTRGLAWVRASSK
ncbi:ATP-binding cassette domain-containing protein [Streptomyces buecherae]|uniref:ATP-binding cassette domain-containing protein n=1 Tax=Streptomyces buecherae TaxID=2763006 RepID=UPI0027E39BD4|nr:ATP-binding cassette domain-containing protein [Streptomyces buecherae]